ncbi:MAG: hypothetical protein AAGA66_03705 [Bacteroidota bacterium]
MPQVQLEFEELQIHRGKKRWKLYFVIVAQHPEEEDKMIVTTTPDPFIRLKPKAENRIDFEPEGVGTDGFLVLKRDMPEDRKLNVRVYLRHSRKDTRTAGEFLQDMKDKLGADAFDIITDVFGATNPWLVIAKKAVPFIGGVLANIKDRDFGMISAFEEFGPEFENQVEVDRSGKFSTGDASLVWSWSID